MMITQNGYLMMLFVQQRLFEGLQPNDEGYYIIRRKEFIERLGIPASTFSDRIGDLVNYYMMQWDLGISFGLDGLGGENLYTDISYDNGMLKFKRNKYTLRPALQYVWARKPKEWESRQFMYEYVPVPDSVELPIKKDL